MPDNDELLNRIYDMNEHIISAIASGKYADADFYAHEIKEIIERNDDAGIGNETQEDILSKILNSPSENERPNTQVSKHINEVKTSAGIVKDMTFMNSSEALSSMCVLVVDDNELNLEIEEAILKKEGYRVLLADSARRAITIFANSLENDIQVILTDIQMPGMDGNEMAKEIRSFDHPDANRVKIIALSSQHTENSIKTSFNAGMNGFIKRPFDITQFKRIVSGAQRV